MPAFGPTKRRDLIDALRRLGFDEPFPGTRHQFMIKGNLRLRIPNPHRDDISTSLLAEIPRHAGISRAEWERV